MQQKDVPVSKSYHDLVVWKLGIQLAKFVYAITAKFPRQETYNLADQLRRAAVSIPSNIAEGQARHTPLEFRRYLHLALGSLAEADTQLILAKEFGYLSESELKQIDLLIQELRMKIHALINSLPH
mgnify:CR=1 FL=1